MIYNKYTGNNDAMQRRDSEQYELRPILVSVPKPLLDFLDSAIRCSRRGSTIIKANIEKATILCSALYSVYEFAETKVSVDLSNRCRLGVPLEISFDERAERLTMEATSLLDELVNMI